MTLLDRLLDNCTNLYGVPLTDGARDRIRQLYDMPSSETWNRAYMLEVTPSLTLWQAVGLVDPRCPASVNGSAATPPESDATRWGGYHPCAMTVLLALRVTVSTPRLANAASSATEALQVAAAAVTTAQCRYAALIPARVADLLRVFHPGAAGVEVELYDWNDDSRSLVIVAVLGPAPDQISTMPDLWRRPADDSATGLSDPEINGVTIDANEWDFTLLEATDLLTEYAGIATWHPTTDDGLGRIVSLPPLPGTGGPRTAGGPQPVTLHERPEDEAGDCAGTDDSRPPQLQPGASAPAGHQGEVGQS